MIHGGKAGAMELLVFGKFKSRSQVHTGMGDKSDILSWSSKDEVIREENWGQRQWKELEKGNA